MESSVKKMLTAYFIAFAAGAFAFLLALNIRAIAVATYVFNADGLPWGMSFVNAVAIILLMIGWLMYVLYVQHYFEKKCSFTFAAFKSAILKWVAPMFILFLISEVVMRF